jgi:hypothetical protein
MPLLDEMLWEIRSHSNFHQPLVILHAIENGPCGWCIESAAPADSAKVGGEFFHPPSKFLLVLYGYEMSGIVLHIKLVIHVTSSARNMCVNC